MSWLDRFKRGATDRQGPRAQLPATLVPIDMQTGQGPATVRHPAANDHDTWAAVLKNDFIRTFAGPKIAEGVSRAVYELVGQPSLVLKVEFTEQTFQNVLEWQFWSSVQFTPWRALFAPCRRISPCGHILIQERTAPLPEGFVMPELPDFLSDQKIENFGVLDGKLVCHDYALHNIIGDRVSRP